MNGNDLARHIKGAIKDAATVSIHENSHGRYGHRVIVVVYRLSGGRPVWMARRHPADSGLSVDTLGHRFAQDYEDIVAPQGR